MIYKYIVLNDTRVYHPFSPGKTPPTNVTPNRRFFKNPWYIIYTPDAQMIPVLKINNNIDIQQTTASF